MYIPIPEEIVFKIGSVGNYLTHLKIDFFGTGSRGDRIVRKTGVNLGEV